MISVSSISPLRPVEKITPVIFNLLCVNQVPFLSLQGCVTCMVGQKIQGASTQLTFTQGSRALYYKTHTDQKGARFIQKVLKFLKMLFSLWTTGASLAIHIDLTTFLVITLLLLIALCVISTPRTDIPGPLALPFVGNLIFFLRMGTRHHEEYLRLYKTYGDIFRLFLGNRMFITICGYENICDAFVRQGSVLSDRPEGLFHPGPGYEKSGIDIFITLAID